MITPPDLWPPFGLVVTAGDLTLSPISDDDLPGLVELALAGIHALDRMPFMFPWTAAPAEELPRRYAQHYWEARAAFTPADFALDLAVRRSGQLVGVQGFMARDYPVTRTAETGSWLVQSVQGQGVGTRMRQAICAFLFDHLDATEITSAAFLDNPASRASAARSATAPTARSVAAGRARLSSASGSSSPRRRWCAAYRSRSPAPSRCAGSSVWTDAGLSPQAQGQTARLTGRRPCCGVTASSAWISP